MDEELVRKLKEAGTRLIFYGIESGAPEVQKRIGKNLDLVKAGEIIRRTAGLDIITGGLFMLGFPEETKEEMQKTVKLAHEMPLHIAIFNYVTPRPHTPLYALLEKKNINLGDTPLYHYKKFSINLSSVTDAGLKRMWAWAYAGFYLRPTQIWRIWKVLPDKRYGFMKIISRTLQYCFPQ